MSDRERELVEVWKAVLAVDHHVGVNESFLDLGGDSLSAIGVLVSMRRLGISEDIARGVVQGKTIAQIVRDEQGLESSAGEPRKLSGPASTSLMINCLRGILVLTVVGSHWLPGLLKRLPAGLAFLQSLFDPFFNLATPGFVIVFGVSLGYYMFPTYRTQRPRVRRMLNLGLLLVGASVLIDECLKLAVVRAKEEPMTIHLAWISLFGPLLYYFLALLTVPVWFAILSRVRWPIVGCLALATAFYGLHRISEVWLLNREQTGLLQLMRLMLVAKYAYFNMSIGAACGMALGMSLKSQPASARLARQLLLGGVVLGLAGLGIASVQHGNLSPVLNGNDMDLWRWPAYGGVVLLIAAALTQLILNYECLPHPVRVACNGMGVLGQCSLLVFVLHGVVLQVKALLDAIRLPEAVTMTVPLLFFTVICANSP